jgi:uncharacterized Zn finger protein
MNKRIYRLDSESGTPQTAIAFLVQGSAAEPYEVVFRRRDARNLSAYCTCPAGENGMYCKHRIRILQGMIEGVVSQNVSDVKKVVSWLTGTDVEEALRSVLALEKQAEQIKAALSAAKHSLARCLLD